MDAHNLATIFAPCILRPDHDKLHATLSQSEQQICVVEMMIERADDLFIVRTSIVCLSHVQTIFETNYLMHGGIEIA